MLVNPRKVQFKIEYIRYILDEIDFNVIKIGLFFQRLNNPILLPEMMNVLMVVPVWLQYHYFN